MNRTMMSVNQAVSSLKQYLLDNVPDGTEVEVTQRQADQIADLAANVTAYGDGQPIDMDRPRERYEAVGWLAATLSGWFDESEFENFLLDCWATSELQDENDFNDREADTPFVFI